MSMLLLSFGILAGFILSSHLDYYVNPCIIIILPIIYLLAATQFPETPQFLIRKQKMDKAHEAFKFYKNLKNPKSLEANKNELQELNTQSGFEELKQNILAVISHSEKLSLHDFGRFYFNMKKTISLNF